MVWLLAPPGYALCDRRGVPAFQLGPVSSDQGLSALDLGPRLHFVKGKCIRFNCCYLPPGKWCLVHKILQNWGSLVGSHLWR